jgi:hypothetical protein
VHVLRTTGESVAYSNRLFDTMTKAGHIPHFVAIIDMTG